MSLWLGRLLEKIVGKRNDCVMEKKMKYEEAVDRLQEIVAAIEAPDAAIANIGDKLKEAMELLEFCRNELAGYENEFEKILNKE